jgi:hypothetical protein
MSGFQQGTTPNFPEYLIDLNKIEPLYEEDYGTTLNEQETHDIDAELARFINFEFFDSDDVNPSTTTTHGASELFEEKDYENTVEFQDIELGLWLNSE